ncbi:hypothetical protein EC527_02970 [Helicobacter pylori]|nr:hypothetical protein EC527_02970 [Helicobacter pylori]
MLKRLAIKQPLKNALSPILGLVFKKSVRIFKLFLLRYFWLCDTKTFIFKNGLLVALFCHFKTHFKKYFKFCKLFYH